MAKRASKAVAKGRSLLAMAGAMLEAEGWSPPPDPQPLLRLALARARLDPARRREAIQEIVAWAQADQRLLADLRSALAAPVPGAGRGRPPRPFYVYPMILHEFEYLRSKGLKAGEAHERMMDERPMDLQTLKNILSQARKYRKTGFI